MTRGAVCDIPRISWVVEFLRIGIGVGDGRVALICVHVAGENKVDRVVEEHGFEDMAAIFADGAAAIRSAYIPWSMARCQTVSFRTLQWMHIEQQIDLPTMTQGVLLLLTACRSFCSHFNWAFIKPKGPLFSPSLPPGSSGAISPCPRSVSVSIVTKWVIPWSN